MPRVAFVLRSTEVHPEFFWFVSPCSWALMWTDGRIIPLWNLTFQLSCGYRARTPGLGGGGVHSLLSFPCLPLFLACLSAFWGRSRTNTRAEGGGAFWCIRSCPVPFRPFLPCVPAFWGLSRTSTRAGGVLCFSCCLVPFRAFLPCLLAFWGLPRANTRAG